MATTEFFTRHWNSGGFPSTWELLSLTIKLSLHSYTHNTGQRLQFLQCFNHPYGIWMQVCWPRLQKKTVIRHPRMHFHPFQSQFCIATTQNSSETRFTRYSHTCMHIVHRQSDTLVLLWLRLRKWLRRGVSKTGVGRGCRMCCWDNSYHLYHPDATDVVSPPSQLPILGFL